MTRRLGVSTLLLLLAVAPTAAQTFVGRNFAGSTFLVDSNFRTPDTMGAAGVDYFVELINGRYSVYRKSDGVRVQTSTQNQFWNNAGQTPSGINGSFDPRVVYDPHARRWYAVAVDNGTNANNFLFAISSSSDPTQAWTAFKIDSDTDDSNWADFPMLGYNGEGVFVSTVMPPLTAPGSRTSFLGFPKFDLLQPTPSIANMARFEDVDQVTAGPVPQLAVDASNTFGESMPILGMSDFGGGSLVRADITPLGSPAIVNHGFIFENAFQPPTVVQPGAPAVQNLESNDWRFSSNTVLHNGQLYGVQAIEQLGRAAVRLLRLDVATNSVIESVSVVDPSLAFTFPSIAVNDFGDVVIGVTGTSTTEFASSYALVRRAGSAVFDKLLLRAGVDNYVQLDSLNRNRWGDYSATTVDPADPGIIWTTQEFVSSANTWSTQVTELILPQTAEARWAEPIDGVFDDPTMWLTAHGGPPLPPDHVVISRALDPGGSITISFPPAPVYVNQSASIRQGNVRLDLGGNQWDLALHLEVGPYYGHPEATVANGIVNSVAGFIALRPTSEGHLTLDNAHWNVADLIVGSAAAPGSGGLLPGAAGGTGSLTIDNNSEIDVGATLKIWQGGTVNLNDGVLTAATIDHTAGGEFNFTGGTLHVDKFNGELRNRGGTLAPGTSIGTTEIQPGYFQRAGGTLAIEIGGTAPADFDHLVTGVAALDGMLDVSLPAGFVPALSDVFDIINAGSVLGTFATSVFHNLGPLLDWHVYYEPTTVVLAIVPGVDGDYNANGVVDTADYVVWRDTLGQRGIGLAADGDRNLVVNQLDYSFWRSKFGNTSGSGSGALNESRSVAVPEPESVLLLIVASIALFCRPSRSRLTNWLVTPRSSMTVS